MSLTDQYSDGYVIAGMTAEGALANGGFLNIYNGSQPTDANTALGAQVLLATINLNATAFGTPVASGSAGSRVVTMTANTMTGNNAVATGTATWYRMTNSSGTALADGSAGTAGTNLVLNTASLVSGIPVSAGTFTIQRSET
jgi:hypothetical protein